MRPALLAAVAGLAVLAVPGGRLEAGEAGPGALQAAGPRVGPAASEPSGRPVQALYAPEFRPVPVLLEALQARGWPGVTARAMGPWAEEEQPDGSRVRVPLRVLLEGERAQVEQAGAWLAALDRPEPAVAVRVLVAEVRRHAARERGGRIVLDRRATAGQDDTLLRAAGASFEPASWLRSALAGAQPFQGTSVTLGAFEHGEQVFAHTLRALAQRHEADILAQSTLVATQGRPAELASQLRMPSMLLVASQGPRGGTPQSVWENRPLDAGLVLRVGCRKAGDGQVLLDLTVTFTTAEPDPEPSAPVSSLVLRARKLETLVSVPHGHTAVLGGLSLVRNLGDRRGMPLLDQLPALDGLVTARGGRNEQTDLVFVLTPYVLGGGALEGVTLAPATAAAGAAAVAGPAGAAGAAPRAPARSLELAAPAPASSTERAAAPGARRRLAGLR
ncbi:MAG: type II secretion system protein GspD [Planctomycetia bacterium]